MRKTFLQILLSKFKLTQAAFARLLGWSPQRVGYLVSKNCQGFPFEELENVRRHLNMSDEQFLRVLDEYFEQ